MDPSSLVMKRAPLVTRGLTVESTTVVMVSPSFLTTLLPVGTMRLMTIVTRFGGGTINSVKHPRGFKKPQLLTIPLDPAHFYLIEGYLFDNRLLWGVGFG